MNVAPKIPRNLNSEATTQQLLRTEASEQFISPNWVSITMTRASQVTSNWLARADIPHASERKKERRFAQIILWLKSIKLRSSIFVYELVLHGKILRSNTPRLQVQHESNLTPLYDDDDVSVEALRCMMQLPCKGIMYHYNI